MRLDPPSQSAVLIFAGLITMHLILRLLRRRSYSDLILLLLMLILGLSFLLEIIYLQWPWLDIALTFALGITGGLHLLSLLRFRD